MEFSVPLPESLEEDGTLHQQWTHFMKRFHIYRRASGVQSASVLLHTAGQEVGVLCQSLDIDIIKLSQILEAVEAVCLSRFILLFERFRYFTFEREEGESLNNFFFIFRKQKELCNFASIKDNIITNTLTNGVADKRYPALVDDAGDNDNRRGGENNMEDKDLDNVISNKSSPIEMPQLTQLQQQQMISNFNEQNYEGDMFMVPFFDNIIEGRLVEDPVVETLLKVSPKKHSAPTKKKTTATVENSNSLGPYLCFVCDRRYTHRKSFRKHITSKHVNSRLFCNHCNKDFKSRTECISHCQGHGSLPFTEEHRKGPMGAYSSKKEEVNTEFQCWFCEMILPNLTKYKNHIETHSAVRVFTCDWCQKKNHTIVRLFGHLKGHLSPRHKCQICANCFSRPELLQAHMESHVAQPGHTCHICEKSFVTADRLNGHMRCHSEEKRFTCELCGRSFSQRVSFDYHKRWHAGEMPYECDICGKKTRSFGDLRKHKRMHSDRRPYVCEVCGKSFRFISNLNRHRKGHSGKRSFVCNVCSRTFIYGEGLRDHIKAGRCPGRRKEGEIKTRTRAQKHMAPASFTPSLQNLQPYIVDNCGPINYVTSNRSAPEVVLNDFTPTWHYMFRSTEAEPPGGIMIPFQ